MTQQKDEDPTNLISMQGRRHGEYREFLLELVDKVEAQHCDSRLLKVCTLLSLHGALIGFDDTLTEDARIAAMNVLANAAAEIAKIGGFPMPQLAAPDKT